MDEAETFTTLELRRLQIGAGILEAIPTLRCWQTILRKDDFSVREANEPELPI
jgi:hypothetical protein